MRYALRTILLFAGIATLNGCALLTSGDPLVVPGYFLQHPAPVVDTFRVGVGKVDITPPAGFPTGGHGPAGSMARGTWTRLYARAFFFRDEVGRVAVFVSCDLFAMPGGLTAQVARDVASKWDQPRPDATIPRLTIPAEAITLAATHTHQSPGNFMTAAAYNEFASKYGGFSPQLFYFLAQRIASAIDLAVDDAFRPGGRVELYVRKRDTGFFQLNRSPRTFMLNADALSTMNAMHPPVDKCKPMEERDEAREDFDLFDCPRRRATNPSLTVLEITRGGRLVGAMVFYAAHPTVLDHHAPFYSSDFAGIAMSTLEREGPLDADGQTPVFGFFNSAEGDVVPPRSARDLRDVDATAKRFVNQVNAALAGPRPENAHLFPRHIEVRSDELKADDSCAESKERVFRLAKKPVMGAPAVGGGENDRTILYQLGFSEGLVEIARKGQGGKLPVLDSQVLQGIRLTKLFAPPRVFPSSLPLRYIQIGSLAIATVPAEVSTMGGLRILDRLQGHDSRESSAARSRFTPGQGDVVVVGLANEYTGYVATAEEYAAQDYMGASTIWGPGELDVFACRLGKLRDALPDGGAAHYGFIDSKTYYPGNPPEDFDKRVTFGPHGIGDRRTFADEELGKILLDARGVPARGLPTVLWMETATDINADFAATRRRRVTIVAANTASSVSTSPTGLYDDGGVGVLTMLLGAPPASAPTQRMMAAIWLGTIFDDGAPAGRYQFRIELTNEDGTVKVCESDAFDVEPGSATRQREPLKARVAGSRPDKPCA